MVASLVATKLNLPAPRSRMVPRPRLRDLMDRGLAARLTLVSAPAGFGKTTLLADWLAQAIPAGTAIAWLSLDDGDSEPTAFWTHVVAALKAGYARVGAAFDMPVAAVMPDQGFLALLLNQLAAGDVPTLLLLDDLHLVDRPEIHAQLAYVIEHLPTHVHVVIGTRADPDLPLARLRVRGDLVEIRAADLRFTAGETSAYLNEVMHLGLSEADAARLDLKTEGWIAALQLAVLSLEGRQDATAFIADFAGSGRYVVDYLVEEVLARLPDDLRRFLMATAPLRRMTAPLCDALTGTPGNGRRMLDRLERQNLFVVPLDAHRQWFRYHHLFADVLRAHMNDAEAAALPDMHRRASLWFESHDERAEAIHHALAAPDYAAAAELIERAIPQMRRHRQEAQFCAWMKPIPDAIVRSRPVLDIAYVGVLLSLGAFDGLEKRLDDAEAGLVALADPRAALTQMDLFRTALAQARGDIGSAAVFAQRVLDRASPDDHLSRAGAAGFLGIVAWSNGALEAAVRFWTQCRDGLRAEGHLADVQGASIALADIRTTQGQPGEALRVCEAALALATDGTRPLARGVADMHASLAILHLDRNDLPVARAELARCEALGEVWGLPQYPYRWRVAQARLDLAEGRATIALDHLRDAEQRYVSDFFPNVRPVPALIAAVHVRMGDLDAAGRWARAADLPRDQAPTFLREFELLTLARLDIAAGGPGAIEAALQLLARLARAAGDGGRQRSLIDIEIATAIAHQARHDVPRALAALRRAIALAEPEAIRRPFLDDDAGLASLLRQLGRQEASAAFLRSLEAEDSAPTPAVKPDHPDLIEPLSEREIDVLRLLRSDLSGPQLADQLSISLNTLRTHTRNIFEKLGVNSRRAAISRAEALHLFGRDPRR